VLAKTEARKAYEKALRNLIKSFITYNPLVTNEDRNDMGLPIHSDTRTPAPVPVTFPEVELDSSVIRRLTIHYHNNGKDRKGKPYGVHGVEIKWEISEVPIVNVEDLTRWENTRGEKGPWTTIANTVIS